jgi:hypothetical protein
MVSNLTANRAMTSDANKVLTSSATTDTELGYLSGTSATGLLKSADVTLTHGQILALNSTPIQIIASPGAGFAIHIDSMICTATFATTAYTSTGSLSIVPSGFTGLTQATCGTGVIEAAASIIKAGGPGSNPTLKENTAYMVWVSAGNPTETGTADTTIKVRAYYRVVPNPLP